jgi:hypothetical protein
MTDPTCGCHDEPMYWKKDARSTAGGYWLCRAKAREARRRWRETHPEKQREYDRRWWEAHPEYNRENSRRWRVENPWHHHHLSTDAYFELLVEQDGRCKGCGITLREHYERVGIMFQVDHDHSHCDVCSKSNGKSCGDSIRGLLCSSCNKRDVLRILEPFGTTDSQPATCPTCGSNDLEHWHLDPFPHTAKEAIAGTTDNPATKEPA